MSARRRRTKNEPALPQRQSRPGDEALSKKEVALRELKAAIRLFFADGDAVAVHVLAAAAGEIVNGVGSANGHRTARRQFLDRVKDAYRPQVQAALTETFAFMKHGARDADARIVFNPDEGEMILLFACDDYLRVFGQTAEEISLFLAYSAESRPDIVFRGSEAFFEQIINVAREIHPFERLDRKAALIVLRELDALRKSGRL